MAWDEDQVKDIIRRLGEVPTLWLKAIIEKNIGTGKARNYRVFPGKIQSISKQYDMEQPEQDEISSAFERLKRAEIRDPGGGSDSVIVGDKQEYVKLTNHGLTLVTIIANSLEIQEFIEEYLGGEPPEESEWFPTPNPEEAPVQLTATTPPPDDGSERFEVEAVAEFPCPYPDCDGEVRNEYSFIHPDESWIKEVEVDCPDCGETWVYLAGHAWEAPSKSDI